MSLSAYQHALARVCLLRRPVAADLGALGGDRDRWLLYREMVRGRLHRQARAGLPRTAALLGLPSFETMVADYLAERGVRSRCVRDVIPELIAFAGPYWRDAARAGTVPGHLPELADYEAAVWVVRSSPADATGQPSRFAPLRFDRPLVVNPVRTTLRLRHAVEDPDRASLLAAESHLVLYRPPGSDRVRQLRVDAVAAALIAEADRDRRCLDARVQSLADAGHLSLEAKRLERLAERLAVAAVDGLVLGSWPE